MTEVLTYINKTSKLQYDVIVGSKTHEDCESDPNWKKKAGSAKAQSDAVSGATTGGHSGKQAASAKAAAAKQEADAKAVTAKEDADAKGTAS